MHLINLILFINEHFLSMCQCKPKPQYPKYTFEKNVAVADHVLNSQSDVELLFYKLAKQDF